MTCPAMMFLSISAVLALLHGQGDAVELDLGTRFPAMPNEEIVVRNDGGVRNETHSFAFGETCHSDPDLKTWFIVRQIVGEHVLVELECLRTVFGDSCPNGTETSKPVAETRARVNAHARETDTQFMEQLRIRGRFPFGSVELEGIGIALWPVAWQRRSRPCRSLTKNIRTARCAKRAAGPSEFLTWPTLQISSGSR
jgi:hypothetical protein